VFFELGDPSPRPPGIFRFGAESKFDRGSQKKESEQVGAATPAPQLASSP